MNQQKGFTLIEVLLSLTLLTTVALTLLQQQWNTRLLVQHLLLRAGASQFLDEINESFYVKLKEFPPAPSPYQFTVQRHERDLSVSLHWFNKSSCMNRTLYNIE